MTWEQLLEAYALARSLAPTTRRGYRNQLRLFQEFCPLEPLALTASHLTAYHLQLLSNGELSSASRTARMRPLLVMLRWAVRRDHLLVDPTTELKLAKPSRPIPRILQPAEVHRLLDAPRQERPSWLSLRDTAILELLYGAGLRASELVGLDLTDLDLADRSLTVAPGKSQARRLPFGERVLQALLAYLACRAEHLQPGETAVFLSRHGARLVAATLSTLVASYGRQLGIPDVSPHALRRAFATHLLENGADIAQVKALLGHSDLNSTMFYALIAPTELVKSYRNAHPRARRLPR